MVKRWDSAHDKRVKLYLEAEKKANEAANTEKGKAPEKLSTRFICLVSPGAGTLMAAIEFNGESHPAHATDNFQQLVDRQQQTHVRIRFSFLSAPGGLVQ